MRSCPSGLATDLASQVTTLCRLLRITRADGTVLRFTDAVANVTIASDGTYLANPSFSCSAIQLTGMATAQSVTITATMNAAGIVEQDLRAQLYDQALGEIFAANWAAPSHGVTTLWTGRFGKVQIGDKGRVQIELKPLSKTARPIGWEKYSPTCRNAFGDVICSLGNTVAQVNLNLLRVQFVVRSVLSPMTFSVAANVTISNPSASAVGYAGDDWTDEDTGIWESFRGGGAHGLPPLVQPEDDQEEPLGLPPSQQVSLFIKPNNYWAGGQVAWLSGQNQGTVQTVRASSQSDMSLSLTAAPLIAIQDGDTGFVYPGCDKLRTTCVLRYNNMTNFRGEPDVPADLAYYSNPYYIGPIATPPPSW